MKLPSVKTVYTSTPVYEGSHFTWGEVTKNCEREIEDLIINGTLLAFAGDIEDTIVETAKSMDRVRQLLGNKPIIVNSWYRPSSVNAQVGGTKFSRHQYGDAVDFVATHLTPWSVANILEGRHVKGGYHTYKSFTHIDWRGIKARWA